MINYKRYILGNGLRVIVHEDATTPMAVVNLLYDVGARDESKEKTGFAHLFEHLMFEGSKNIKNYDQHIHQAGGESNAFTGSDITNYYDVLPAANIETAFWLESDRMMALDLNEASLKLQKSVVSEEYKEHYINKPYGDVWHKIRGLAYQQHPYQWPVIGSSLAHIENATMQDVQAFYQKHYRPNHAILTVVGGVEAEAVRQLADKWFGEIPSNNEPARQVPKEPIQTEFRQLTVEADVPIDALYMGFHTCNRTDRRYHAMDMVAEYFSSGSSSRLFQKLVKEKELFSTISSYLTGDMDEGMFFIYGKLSEGVQMADAEAAIWAELDSLKQVPLDVKTMEKLKNKAEASTVFSEMSLMNRAFYLAFFELLGDIDLVNQEIDKLLALTAADLQAVAQQIFRKENCSTMYYYSKQKSQATINS